jgi:hypothetical protein
VVGTSSKILIFTPHFSSLQLRCRLPDVTPPRDSTHTQATAATGAIFSLSEMI